MQVNLGIWDKLAKLMVFFLFMAGMFGVVVWYFPLIKQNERMRQQLLQLESKIKKEEDIGKSLRSSVEAAKNDPKTVERLARAHLRYAKPGEIVIRFEEPGFRR